MKSRFLAAALLVLTALCGQAQKRDLTQYVNTLQGTNSNFGLSHGNTFPATAMPFGVHMWTPQTGRNGDGFKYLYTADKIRGFGQSHQCSPWVNNQRFVNHAENLRCYFVIQFDKPFKDYTIGKDGATLVFKKGPYGGALGLYAVTPGTDQYVLDSPLFRKATVTLEDGKQFVIEAHDNSPENIYIQSATLNGQPLLKNYITYDDIIRGGHLIFQMGPEPNKQRNTTKEAAPFSMSKPLR